MNRLSVVLAVVALAGCGRGDDGRSAPWDQNGDGLVGSCEGLSRSACSATPSCRGEDLACLALCLDNGFGGCLPCPETFRCVPEPRRLPPVPRPACETLTDAQCSVDARCQVTVFACAAVCEDDGQGGCTPGPCTSPSVCVPVAPPRSTCADLAADACIAAGCTLTQLDIACTMECRDDGQGGCLPCKDFLCSDTSGGSGGGAPPSKP